MPQVMLGEGTEPAGEQWSCGDCAAEGKEFRDEEAKVILHSVKTHGAYNVSRDAVKKLVRAQAQP